MTLVSALKSRKLVPEIMDQADLDESRHFGALRGLSRINLWSASAAVQWRALAKLLVDQRLETLRVLDIATGAGDVPTNVWRKARRAGVRLHMDGCDANPRAVDFARAKAQRRRCEVNFFPLNALEAPLPQDYDVITCSLFLHHLRDEQAVELIRRMASAARRMILVDDLQRTPSGFAMAYVGTRLLTRSKVVHEDGLRSVAAAFTMEEAEALAKAAGLDGAKIEPHWPYRYLLTWTKS